MDLKIFKYLWLHLVQNLQLVEQTETSKYIIFSMILYLPFNNLRLISQLFSLKFQEVGVISTPSQIVSLKFIHFTIFLMIIDIHILSLQTLQSRSLFVLDFMLFLLKIHPKFRFIKATFLMKQ